MGAARQRRGGGARRRLEAGRAEGEHQLDGQRAARAAADAGQLEGGQQHDGRQERAEQDAGHAAGERARQRAASRLRLHANQQRHEEPRVGGVDGELREAGQQAHAGREADPEDAASPGPARDVVKADEADAEPGARLLHAGVDDVTGLRAPIGDQHRAQQCGGQRESEAQAEDEGRAADQEQVQDAGERHAQIDRQQHIEEVRGIEEADLQGRQGGDAAELVGIPERQTPARDLVIEPRVARVVVLEGVERLAGVGDVDLDQPEGDPQHDQQAESDPLAHRIPRVVRLLCLLRLTRREHNGQWSGGRGLR
jgi:hypothetical protein